MVIWLAASAWATQLQLRLETRSVEVGQSLDAVVVLDDWGSAVPTLVVPAGVTVKYVGQTNGAGNHNGVRSVFQQFQYVVTPTAQGSFTVGPAELDVRGTPITSNTVTLDVVAPRPAQEAPLRVETVFAPSAAYEGQVVVHTDRLLSRVSIAGVDWTRLSMDGLGALRLAPAETRTATVEDARGGLAIVEQVQARVVTARRDLEVDPAVARVQVPKTSRRTLIPRIEYQVAAGEAVTLQVEPLPPPPPDFSGLVGDFVVEVDTERAAIRVGESLNQTVRITGDGALEGFALPPVTDQSTARFYEQAPEVAERLDGARFVAEGTFRRVAVPTAEGTVTLPAVEVVAFSPTKGAYVTHRVDGAVVTVLPGAATDADLESFAPLSAPKPPDAAVDGVRPPIRSGAAVRVPTAPWLLGGAALLLAGIAGVLSLDLVRWLRNRPARAVREPTPAERLAGLPEGPDGLGVLDRALREAIGLRIGIPWTLVDAAAATSLPDADEIAAVLGALDRARFAGAPAGAELLGRVVSLVDRLDRGRAA